MPMVSWVNTDLSLDWNLVASLEIPVVFLQANGVCPGFQLWCVPAVVCSSVPPQLMGTMTQIGR